MTSSQISIGELRHLVSILNPVRSDDGGGGASVTWAVTAQAWAAIREKKGIEIAEADRQWGLVVTEVWLRWRPGITAAMRVGLGSGTGARIFDIRAVLNVDDRQRWLRLICQELKP